MTELKVKSGRWKVPIRTTLRGPIRQIIHFSLFTFSFSLTAVGQPADLEIAKAFDARVRSAVEKVLPAFCFIGGGSGVVISADGWIITNHHVAGMSKKWTVRLTGGKRYKADLVGFDPRGDLALLKIRDGKDLPHCDLADSDVLKVGRPVFAVGNPFLLGNETWEPTVTLGIVSALHRFADGYSDAIQTDAQINPGNSGGPLFTLDGEVAGINGQIRMRWDLRVNSGVGYAIPSNQIRRFLPELEKGGRVYHAAVEGLVITQPEIYGSGALVYGIEEASPADKAGLNPGDLIREIDGFPVFNTKRFHGVIGTYPPGATVTMKVLTMQNGQETEHEVPVYLGRPPEIREKLPPDAPFAGVYFYPPAEKDAPLEVEDVVPGGPASRASIEPGDAILTVDEKPVKDAEAWSAAVAAKKPGDVLKLKIRRGGQEGEMELKLGRFGDWAPPEKQAPEPPKPPAGEKKKGPTEF